MDRDAWDAEAATFDEEPDHSLTSPAIRSVWRDLLLSVLPAPPARVADLGCGTGTLTGLLTEEGYPVDGLDFSPQMIARAREKVPGARFVVADAARPPLAAGQYDAVLCRHVLWAMEDPPAALSRWLTLLRPGGTVVLVEGRWSTGGGLTAARTEEIVLGLCEEVELTPLTSPDYWGKDITDERYLAVTHRR